MIDDDAAIREGLSELILSAGFEPVSFGSTRELLDADVLDSPGCLILDVRIPGASGLDLQRQVAGNGNPKPIIFLTGRSEEHTSELQSLMRISYAVFCLKKKNTIHKNRIQHIKSIIHKHRQ